MLKSKVKKLYEKHDCLRVCQGDILRDFVYFTIYIDGDVKKITFPYIIIISQDCDLEYGIKKNIRVNNREENIVDNQYLPNILFLPAFLLELIKEGNHLQELFNINQDRLNSDRIKIIKQNKDERYHFLGRYPDYQMPELVIDFKAYFAVSKDYFLDYYKDFYLATLNELFRENLSQRFSNYLSRIGLPVLKEAKINKAAKK